MTSAYLVRVTGCDATTRVLVDLTDVEFATVAKVAEAVTAAGDYSCQPRMRVVPREDADESDLEALAETGNRRMVDAAELADAYRRVPLWHQAVSDAQALIVAEMRAMMATTAIAAALSLSNKRIYQLLDEAKDTQADPRRLRRATAIAELASTGED